MKLTLDVFGIEASIKFWCYDHNIMLGSWLCLLSLSGPRLLKLTPDKSGRQEVITLGICELSATPSGIKLIRPFLISRTTSWRMNLERPIDSKLVEKLLNNALNENRLNENLDVTLTPCNFRQHSGV